MNVVLQISLISWMAGFTALVGGFLAFVFAGGKEISHTRREILHGIIAFGGGILLAAVAFALLPEAVAELSPPSLGAVFCLGGLAFCILDAQVGKQGGSKAQLMAMLIDFIPEAIALGALFGHSRKTGILLAIFIAAQNLPEGFNAFREMSEGQNRPGKTLKGLFLVSFLGPVAACTGHFLLQNNPLLTACIMAFAAGGIVYLIFQDIAPQARMQRHWTPPLGAVAGFALGMIGNQLLGH